MTNISSGGVVLKRSLLIVLLLMFTLFGVSHSSAYTEDEVYTTEYIGATWATLGDSISLGIPSGYLYQSKVMEKLKFSTLQNLAVSGSSLVGEISKKYTEIAVGTDVITVFGGTNDFGTGKPIGHYGDTNPDETIYGAVDYLCKGLLERFPTATIVFITPTQRNFVSGGDTGWNNENSQGYTIQDVGNAIKLVCNSYAIRVLDGSTIIPINKYTASTYLVDGLHPNEAGMNKIADVLIDFLSNSSTTSNYSISGKMLADFLGFMANTSLSINTPMYSKVADDYLITNEFVKSIAPSMSWNNNLFYGTESITVGGVIEFKMNTTGSELILGISNSTDVTNSAVGRLYNKYTSSFYLAPTKVYTYKSTPVEISPIPYALSDVFKIKCNANNIELYINDVLKYTEVVTPVYPLRIIGQMLNVDQVIGYIKIT